MEPPGQPCAGGPGVGLGGIGVGTEGVGAGVGTGGADVGATRIAIIANTAWKRNIEIIVYTAVRTVQVH